jgi:hypothetical protein
MKRNWNWAIWVGALVVLGGVLSYPLFFIRIPALRDFPWANLPLIGLGLVLIGVGMAAPSGNLVFFAEGYSAVCWAR